MHLVGDALLSSAATDRTGLGIGLLLSFLKQQPQHQVPLMLIPVVLMPLMSNEVDHHQQLGSSNALLLQRQHQLIQESLCIPRCCLDLSKQDASHQYLRQRQQSLREDQNMEKTDLLLYSLAPHLQKQHQINGGLTLNHRLMQ